MAPDPTDDSAPKKRPLARRAKQVSLSTMDRMEREDLQKQLTHGRIRRVKCDEGQPACVRCISTGRKCDGYDINAKPRSRQNQTLVKQIPIRRIYPPTPSLPRPLQADISGTEMERFYFHCFRSIAGQAVGIRHKYNAMFWKDCIPRYCYEVDSVRHAFVAFGAAYHNFQTAGERVDPAAPPSRTERFIIQQYTLALSGLAQDIQQVNVRRQYGIVLISCLAFFCVEMLRNDGQAALTHLSNGLQLMANLPDEVADILQNPEKWSQGADTSHARVLYMMRLLSRWETSMRLITGNFRPMLTLLTYESRKLDATSGMDASSLEGIYEAVDSYCQDVSAFAWLTRDRRGDIYFWDQRRPKIQHSVLAERSTLLGEHFLRHINSGSLGRLQAQDLIFFHSSMLRHKGATLVLKMLPLPEVLSQSPEPDELSLFEDFITSACTVRYLLTSSTDASASSDLNADLAVVPALYVTGSNCRDEGLRRKILHLAMEWPQRENLWDGPALRHMLDTNGLKPSRTKVDTNAANAGNKGA
ncbi:hypothetical protein QQS21_006167 [Conoideocrella luteorostrata]|uniref:Zn(2)-C6 fungal-type domain-containing protein n=1 Tax=Conoideocrella luteorostrata TaxID=1105319 RepID=A0AAJ0FT68_9HYPO|nr:hypothetical protein QQS21_006167 [Conoideocrella luteorostrata]